jgi:hypothetical protein
VAWVKTAKAVNFMVAWTLEVGEEGYIGIRPYVTVAIGLELEIGRERDFDCSFDSSSDTLHRHVEPARKCDHFSKPHLVECGATPPYQ